jgi:hypothetical protein
MTPTGSHGGQDGRGLELYVVDQNSVRCRWLPVLDKLRTFSELDPETVEILTL